MKSILLEVVIFYVRVGCGDFGRRSVQTNAFICSHLQGIDFKESPALTSSGAKTNPGLLNWCPSISHIYYRIILILMATLVLPYSKNSWAKIKPTQSRGVFYYQLSSVNWEYYSKHVRGIHPGLSIYNTCLRHELRQPCISLWGGCWPVACDSPLTNTLHAASRPTHSVWTICTSQSVSSFEIPYKGGGASQWQGIACAVYAGGKKTP